ncbi:hypothetical protein D3C76_1556950 [compost metagenome]
MQVERDGKAMAFAAKIFHQLGGIRSQPAVILRKRAAGETSARPGAQFVKRAAGRSDESQAFARSGEIQAPGWFLKP